jgi:hypothetical protein
LLRYIREQVNGDVAPDPDPEAGAQTARFRRVLAALDLADLTAIGRG